MRNWRSGGALKNAHAAPARSLSAALRPLPHRPLAIGFYVNWDDTSYAALKRALPKLDWVLPSWLSLAGPDMHLKVTHGRQGARRWCAKCGPPFRSCR